VILKEVCKIIRQAGYEISNVDCTVCLQKPKIKDYIDEMRALLSIVMDIDTDSLSIKATTEEKLGFTGREEGIACYATCLIYSGF
jgi:2-C-methyl-D-erythritol 2,4-cyclodiphosphate synthase